MFYCVWFDRDSFGSKDCIKTDGPELRVIIKERMWIIRWEMDRNQNEVFKARHVLQPDILFSLCLKTLL